MSYQLRIITPEGKLFDEVVDSLSAPGLLGGFEVYSQHAPMINALTAGQVKVRKATKEICFELSGGILEVTLTHDVLLLADQATPKA